MNEVAAPGRQHPDDRISVVLDKGCGRPPRGVKGKGRFPFQQRHGPVLGDFVGDRGSRHPAANDDYIDGEFGLGGVAHVTSISVRLNVSSSSRVGRENHRIVSTEPWKHSLTGRPYVDHIAPQLG
ncbi:Uncharacterised protein [Mycobacteroides abscessus subsp. abscessus]|nr:Uncharacterised protein [Mycobacteroides abscessus subsp. abscessus]SLC50415.1 Uncharacterised protein [Mycobacteroides abscessus subsp. abscessus]